MDMVNRTESMSLGQLEMHYQKQWCEERNELVGLEALIRMRQGEMLLTPDRFLEDLARAGLLREVTRFTMQQVCRDVADLNEGGARLEHVGVNFSCEQIADPHFREDIETILAHSSVEPGQIVIEITETAQFGDLAQLERLIDSLNSMGVLFALDDFCTGFSCLEHLCRLPVDILKIDRAFVSRIEEYRGRIVVETLIEMARRMEVATVAEGVERFGQIKVLKQLGCSVFQGYYYGEPLDYTTLSRELVRSGRSHLRVVS